MRIIESIQELRTARAGLDAPLGFVPTMGFLHEGHLSLVRRARSDCKSVAVSIFVNPTQFGPQEDLAAYPRDLERDLGLLKGEGVDLVWTPTSATMYPEGFQTWVSVDELTQHLEGLERPGHFRGVTTVVAKLFNAVGPDRAYFGQKDAQQATVIRRMVADLDFPIEVLVCPTVREADGLAKSSRNTYLNEAQRKAATVLFRSLTAAVEMFGGGERDAETLREKIMAVLRAEPMAKVQYVSIADPDSLDELSGEITRALLSMAVYIGETRLIDNMLVSE